MSKQSQEGIHGYPCPVQNELEGGGVVDRLRDRVSPVNL